MHIIMLMMKEEYSGWSKLVLALFIAAEITIIIVLFVAITNRGTSNSVTHNSDKTSKPVSLESKILMVGEVFWGRYARDASLASELKYEYPFSGLSTFNKENYDAWYAQLECPITDNNLTSPEQEATLTFNCRPEFLPSAAEWFEIFNLANNHTDNMGGQTGLEQTRSYLEDAGVQHHGHYSNSVVSELCEVVDLPVRVSYLTGAVDTTNFPVVFCGFHNVFQLPTEGQLDVISDYSKHFLTIVSPQMGAEYVPNADAFKTSTYRAMIDRGADAVIASHPHWVQNTEVYKDKLIAYSVGNFMFDQQDSLEVRRGVAIDITISSEDTSELMRWLNSDLKCGEFKDDCLARASRLGLEKPEFILEYDAVPSYSTSYVTSKAPQEVATGVLERLNWQSTMKQLEEVYE